MKIRKYHNTLAARMLQAAADEFGNHGCNDVDPKWFEGVGVRSRAALLTDFNDWYMSTFHVPVLPLDFVEIRDDQWMEYMAWKLSGEPLNWQY